MINALKIYYLQKR